MLRILGKSPSGKRLERIKNSPNYKNGAFQNIEPTEAILKDASMPKMLKEIFFNRPANLSPAIDVTAFKIDLTKLSDTKSSIVWFGHSSYYINHHGFKILVDPVLSGHASPFSSMVKAFKGADIYKAEDIPEIDLLLITHDHYDHLDYKVVLKLKHKFKKVLTALGVGSHLEYWGIDSNKIVELDWWESYRANENIEFTSTPSRHFSGRTLKRANTLWSSFVLDLGNKKIFLGGDSGYDSQFKKIGEKYGPFELAILDCAQYGANWPYIHMVPEQTTQAALDLQAKVLLPVHWGKFALANHPWTEPIERINKSAEFLKVFVNVPVIGQVIEF
ncbi:MAG: MBL fold metallo-hydrolase [Bacteroidia bacterium]|jgi:L-ascorbate metabolism protein UlaG (beta-lactamase superfamily)|nr:MBL fold metallo-hydrolase [Bacteroidota bacterium]MBK7572310.1 MBL fold metallo-hydrolase [Bacteroidota bacterium]MBP9789138.1 MBL fold metallo-hydrolase [Bacteroidia bacterium]MBP9922453.1 MBL fold metallo-hydrolase [Bacteroidia bacterium]